MIGETRLKAALLGSGAAIALLASPAVADEVTDLKAQVEALQNRLDQLEIQQTKIASEQVAPAQAITAGEFPGSIKLGETSLALSGYVKLDAMYTMGAPGDKTIGDSFIISNIPADGSVRDNQDDDMRLHARQSRFRIDSRSPTEWGSLRTRIEGDFFGAGGNQTFSNSNSFRLRHAYGSLGPLLFGQTWTTFMDQDAFFDTVDFAGATGAEFGRQAQIRYTADMGNGLSADVAIENPDGRLDFVTVTSAGAGTNDIDKAPDFVGALRYRQDWGAVNFSVLGRYLTYDNGLGQEDSTWGYGLHGGVTVNVFGKDSISGVFNYGDGMGRYMAGNGGFIPAAVVSCSTPAFTAGAGVPIFVPGCGANLETQTSWGGWGAYAHQWTDTLRSNIIYGYSEAHHETSLRRGSAFGAIEEWQSLHVNLMWSPVPKVTFGIEFMEGWIDTVDLNRTFAPNTDDDANKSRIQLGMQVNFP